MAVYVRCSDESQESMREASFDRSKAISVNNNSNRPKDDDPPLISVNKGIITVERMSELVLRYKMPSGYICKILAINEHGSTPGPLKIGVCKESFRARFCVPIHPFI